MSRNTVVKTTKIQLGGTLEDENGRVTETVREWKASDSNGYRFQPVSAGDDLVVFSEAHPYDANALEERKNAYDEYFNTRDGETIDKDHTEGSGDPHAAANAAVNYDIDRVYGDYSFLNFAVASPSDASRDWKVYVASPSNAWKQNYTRIDSIVMPEGRRRRCLLPCIQHDRHTGGWRQREEQCKAALPAEGNV